MLPIKDVMIQNVVTVEPDDMLSEAAAKMSSKGISCVVVLDHGKAAGIVTRRDIMERVVVNGLNPQVVKVSERMTSPVITINEEEPLVKAAEMMNERGIKQVPVVTNEGLVTGIITQTDIVKNLKRLIAGE